MENIDNKQTEARNRNLLRFVHAQDSGGLYDGTGTYAEALQEVKNGHKRGHWIWYVFPQMKGLGKSEIALFYGINGREEAKSYIEHPMHPLMAIRQSGPITERNEDYADLYTRGMEELKNFIESL